MVLTATAGIFSLVPFRQGPASCPHCVRNRTVVIYQAEVAAALEAVGRTSSVSKSPLLGPMSVTVKSNRGSSWQGEKSIQVSKTLCSFSF